MPWLWWSQEYPWLSWSWSHDAKTCRNTHDLGNVSWQFRLFWACHGSEDSWRLSGMPRLSGIGIPRVIAWLARMVGILSLLKSIWWRFMFSRICQGQDTHDCQETLGWWWIYDCWRPLGDQEYAMTCMPCKNDDYQEWWLPGMSQDPMMWCQGFDGSREYVMIRMIRMILMIVRSMSWFLWLSWLPGICQGFDDSREYAMSLRIPMISGMFKAYRNSQEYGKTV
jgi:hypothetical protein